MEEYYLRILNKDEEKVIEDFRRYMGDKVIPEIIENQRLNSIRIRRLELEGKIFY